MTHEELMYASEEDLMFYQMCEKGLYSIGGMNGTGNDEDGIPIPYHCGPHSVKCLREIVGIIKPKSIFEIGFNCGHSSSMWLNLSNADVFSCDISKKKETLHGASTLWAEYGDRFTYCDRNDEFFIGYLKERDFDVCFVDGGHLYEDVIADIDLCLELNIPYIAFDDIIEDFGPGVMPAIKKYPQLELVKELGNIALYKNTTV